MNDQTQQQPDPSAEPVQRKRKLSRRAQSGEPAPVPAPSSQSTATREDTQPRATQQSPQSAGATRQLSAPQPILFQSIGVEVLEEIEPSQLPRKSRFVRTRRCLRSRGGRIIVPLIALLVGLAVGLGSVLWYGLSGEGRLLIVPRSAQGNLIVEADKSFVTQLVSNDITNAGLPGQVKNINVTLAHGDALTVQGDDVYTVLVLSLSRHFVVHTQPYVQSCVLQIRVTSANLGGIPVTGFVQSFESKINQQLAKKPTGLPGGFTYCTVGVRTEVGGMFITYQAIPVGR